MAVVISEVTTEVVVAPASGAGDTAGAGTPTDDVVDLIVRRATERVVELLRREWDL